MSRLEAEWQFIDMYEAGRKEVGRKATGNGTARRGGKQQKAQGPAVAAASKTTAKAPVDGCWHCEGPHLGTQCPQLRGGK